MSSVLARTKQIPVDSQYFVSLVTTSLSLQYFNDDPAASTTSYVSGAAAGFFTTSNVPATSFDASGGTAVLFRDMGITILSSGRTFRAVQRLRLDGNPASKSGGQTGWDGVWQPSPEGISGAPSTSSATSGSSFDTFYFETGARGLGIAQGLVRYG